MLLGPSVGLCMVFVLHQDHATQSLPLFVQTTVHDNLLCSQVGHLNALIVDTSAACSRPITSHMCLAAMHSNMHIVAPVNISQLTMSQVYKQQLLSFLRPCLQVASTTTCRSEHCKVQLPGN